jgi:hypothetical protein
MNKLSCLSLGMKPLIFSVLLFVVPVSFFGQTDSIKTQQKVSYFIVGRIRTSPLDDGAPFKVQVIRVNGKLLGQSIGFKIVDLQHYKITYTLGDKEIAVDGSFGVELSNPDLKLVIQKESSLVEKNLDALKTIVFQFVIGGASK